MPGEVSTNPLPVSTPLLSLGEPFALSVIVALSAALGDVSLMLTEPNGSTVALPIPDS